MLIIKIIVSVTLALIVIFHTPSYAGGESFPAVSAHSAIVYHSGGETVYEKNADEHMLFASTTKIMTAIIAIEKCEIDEEVEIKDEYCRVEGSSIYLRSGEKHSVRHLLYGLMLESGNDAALALSGHVSGSMESFVTLMNEKAQELGMENTHYENPHGLNAEGHYSCARDQAVLMDYCMKNQLFSDIVGTRSCESSGQSFINHNKLLDSCPGCIGGKTGYTGNAGRCLVSCCERQGTRFICVTLSAPKDWEDHQRLYDWAFSMYSDRDVSDDVVFESPLTTGQKKTVGIMPEKLVLFLPKKAQVVIEARLPSLIFPPVKKGETAGRFCVIIDDKIIGEGRLLFAESVA